MGLLITKLVDKLSGSKHEVPICVFGCESSGKTTIINKLSSQENFKTVPKVGLKVD